MNEFEIELLSKLGVSVIGAQPTLRTR